MRKRKGPTKKEKIDLQTDMLELSMQIKSRLFPMREDDLLHAAPTLRSAGANMGEFLEFVYKQLKDSPVSGLSGVFVTNLVYLFICTKIGTTRLAGMLLEGKAHYAELRKELDAFKDDSSFWKFLDRLLEDSYAPQIIVNEKGKV